MGAFSLGCVVSLDLSPWSRTPRLNPLDPSCFCAFLGTVSRMVEAARVLSQARSQYARGLRSIGALSPLALLTLAAWVLVSALDGVSTYVMMSSGLFEEANPVAAALMDVFGMGLVVVVASLFVVALGVWTVARPRGVYAWVIFSSVALIGVLKLAVGVSNVQLAVLGSSFL